MFSPGAAQHIVDDDTVGENDEPASLSTLAHDLQDAVLSTLDVPSLCNLKATCHALATPSRRTLSTKPAFESRRLVHQWMSSGADDLSALEAMGHACIVEGLQELRCQFDGNVGMLTRICLRTLSDVTMKDVIDGLDCWEGPFDRTAALLVSSRAYTATASCDVVAEAVEQLSGWPVERTASLLFAWDTFSPTYGLWSMVLSNLQAWVDEDSYAVPSVAALMPLLVPLMNRGVKSAQGTQEGIEHVVLRLAAEWGDATQLGVMLRSWARATETTRLSGPVSEAILHFAFVSAPQRHHGIQTRVTPFGQIRPTVTWTGWPLAERMATIIEEAFALGPDDPLVAPEDAIIEWLDAFAESEEGQKLDWWLAARSDIQEVILPNACPRYGIHQSLKL